MRRWLNQTNLNLFITTCALVTLVSSLAPIALAEAAPGAAPGAATTSVLVTVNKGWTKFSWVPSVRGAFTFSPRLTAIDATLLNLPSLVMLTASAKVKCPATGDAVVGAKVYDFGKLILAASYPVSCTRFVDNPMAIKTGDDYLNNSHYFHMSVPLAAGGSHDLSIVTDLATTDTLFWGYLRVDTAPSVPMLGSFENGGAIAATVINPPANAWVVVQWGIPDCTQWFDIPDWSGPLDQAAVGRTARWVDAKNFGTGPFRWVVYDQDPQQGGKLWGASDPFFFPRVIHDWVWITVRPTPGQ